MARVYVSAVINAPLARVWREIRDFNALPQWHPLVASSVIEDGRASDSVGCVRNFQLKEQPGTLREQLLGLSDAEHSCTYSILEAPLAVRNYVATLRLAAVTEGDKTFGEWTAEFQVPAEIEDETAGLVGAIFREGLANLNKRLANN